MAMTIPKLGDIKKFSFGEMTSNDNGKTSGTSSAGLYIIFIGGLCFFLGCIDKMFLDKSLDIINQSVMFTTIGAALLGVKNIVAGKKTTSDTPDKDSPTQLNS
jgi:hypothetical protein